MTIRDLIPWRRRGEIETSPTLSSPRDVSRLFDDFFRKGMTPWEEFPAFPEIDITENDTHVDVTAEVPGLSDKEIKLSVDDGGGALTIEGEKRSETETQTDDVVWSERRYGKFRRVVALPCAVDTDKVEATCKDGVLRVRMNRLPDTEQNKRSIPIQST